MNSFQSVNAGFSLIAIGFTASLLAGLATTIGALPVLFVKGLSAPAQGVMLGFGAGVMLAASFFSLILPGLQTAHAQGANDVQGRSVGHIGDPHREGHEIRGTVGLMVGFVVMMFLDVVLG